MMRALLCGIALLAAAPALAQAPAAPALAQAPAAPDSARLAAAKRTVEVMLPPAQRAAMFDAMLNPMMKNMQQTLLARPGISEAMQKDAKAKAVFDRFVADQQRQLMALLQRELPGMFQAMERAYASRFSVAQLGEITAFFSTPTGRYYMDESMKMPADPEMLAWQRGMMERSMAQSEASVEKLVAELTAENGK